MTGPYLGLRAPYDAGASLGNHSASFLTHQVGYDAVGIWILIEKALLFVGIIIKDDEMQRNREQIERL